MLLIRSAVLLHPQIDKDRPVLPAYSAYIKMNRVYSYATHISATHYFIFADLRQYMLLLSHKHFGHSNQTDGHTAGHRKIGRGIDFEQQEHLILQGRN